MVKLCSSTNLPKILSPGSESFLYPSVTYNSSSALREFWRQGIPKHVEWIVVDNASSDESATAARELGATLVIEQGENLGFSQACNLGLAHASGDLIAFVNPDVRIDIDTLPILEDVLQQQEALVAPQMTYPDGTLQPNGRGAPSLWNKVINRLRPPEGANRYYRFAQPGELPYVCWVIGAALCGRRSTFERLGGWDDTFFIYYEDSDIGIRAWKAGIPVRLIGDARWTHGWARETTSLRLDPWKRELPSMITFYSRYPHLLGPGERFCENLMKGVKVR